MELKTPLYEAHVKAGGKIVPFGGYLLPVQYKEGVIKEHMAVRTQAGLFDVSHMGEILCQGKDALANLQMMLTNNFDNLTDGQARYSPMCNEQGGTVDDLIVYKKGDEDYFIVVNAANKDKDYQWMLDHQFGEVTFTDVSDQYAQLALQGPKAMEILRKLAPEENIPKKYYHAVFDTEPRVFPVSSQRPVTQARTGGRSTWTAQGPRRCGTLFSRPGRRRDSSPADWEPETLSGWRQLCPSTATRWTNR